MSIAAVPEEEAETEFRVKPLELFFDLVFVFALTQVTALLAADVSWEQVARGLLVLAALWWAWAGYTWITTNIDPEEGAVRLVFFAAMAAWLVAGLAVPGAFNEHAVVFGGAYFLVRVMHVGVFYLGARGNPELSAAVTRAIPIWIFAPVMILAASFLDGTAQGVVWAVALVIDYASGLVGGGGGWKLHAGHFAERHGLIIIVALGESIVAVGAGAEGVDIGAGVIATACLGLAVVAAIWWSYFDVAAIVAEQRLRAAVGAEQGRMGRDSFSYLHLPMVAGIVLFAFGMKKVIGHYDEPLKDVAGAALAGGVSMYLFAHIGFRYRNTRSYSRPRVVVATVLALFAGLFAGEPAGLVSLAIVTAVVVGLIAFESVRQVEARRRIRSARH